MVPCNLRNLRWFLYLRNPQNRRFALGTGLAAPRAMWPSRLHSLLLSLALVVSVACEQKPAGSPELQAILTAGAPRGVDEQVWADVQKLYAARQQTLVWSSGDKPSKQSTRALETLRAAETHGLNRARYGEAEITTLQAELMTRDDGKDPERANRLADLDVRLTSALLLLGRHVAIGASKPQIVDARWNIRRASPDLVAALDLALAVGVTGFLDAVGPRHPEYGALQKSLASLRGQATRGWPTVPRVTLRMGQSHSAVTALRQRLANGGYLPSTAAQDSPRYDADVEAALGRFQEHHALKPTGHLDPATLAAMNVPLEARLSQVAMNLERWRWLPDDLGARHLLVNIPYFHLIAREDGKAVLDTRVVVGKPGNETPTFSDEMTHVVFSPYWNIPETIALEETAPAIARDPNYLARNNMEVVNASGGVVPASSIPWGDEQAVRGLSFRQRPGATNALGLVKFMFPNQHNVYLHDTPTDSLFSRIGRAFSHGCVRVEEPETLAAYVLRDQPKWTAEAIHDAMRAGEEQHVKLSQPLPVHLIYMTAWVDDRGGLHFQDDVYGYDVKQARAKSRLA